MNPKPHPSEGCALPLSYPPQNPKLTNLFKSVALPVIMASAQAPPESRLFIAVTYSDDSLLPDVKSELVSLHGEALDESKVYKFDFTDYYKDEMGTELKKFFIVFQKLIDPAELPKIKLQTNQIEAKYSANNKRRVNLDPGYITVHHLILASCKPRPHRVYLGEGIYADMVFIFQRNKCLSFRHTFPDFRQDNVQGFFLEQRKKLLDAIQQDKN